MGFEQFEKMLQRMVGMSNAVDHTLRPVHADSTAFDLFEKGPMAVKVVRELIPMIAAMMSSMGKVFFTTRNYFFSDASSTNSSNSFSITGFNVSYI